MEREIIFASAINDDRIFHACLKESFRSEKKKKIIELRNYTNASTAYNMVLEVNPNNIVVFVHQDVYLPLNWVENLIIHIEQLEESDPDWAVLGVVGATEGGIVGHLWSTGINKEIGKRFDNEIEVESLDELLLVVNNRLKLRFDERLPGFHFFGTDIVQIAKSHGFSSYAIDLPVIHNDRQKYVYDSSYIECYKYMKNKWKNKLPIKTCTFEIKKSALPLMIRNFKFKIIGENRPNRIYDPRLISRDLNYDNYNRD